MDRKSLVKHSVQRYEKNGNSRTPAGKNCISGGEICGDAALSEVHSAGRCAPQPSGCECPAQYSIARGLSRFCFCGFVGRGFAFAVSLAAVLLAAGRSVCGRGRGAECDPGAGAEAVRRFVSGPCGDLLRAAATAGRSRPRSRFRASSRAPAPSRAQASAFEYSENSQPKRSMSMLSISSARSASPTMRSRIVSSDSGVMSERWMR